MFLLSFLVQEPWVQRYHDSGSLLLWDDADTCWPRMYAEYSRNQTPVTNDSTVWRIGPYRNHKLACSYRMSNLNQRFNKGWLSKYCFTGTYSFLKSQAII